MRSTASPTSDRSARPPRPASRRHALAAATSVAALSLLCAAATARDGGRGPASPLVRYEATRMSMGCAYAIAAYAADRAALAAIVDQAFDEVDRIDRLMSHYKPESPLSRLNRDASASANVRANARASGSANADAAGDARGAGPVHVDPELFDLIAEAVRYSRESDGAFDITVGPLMNAWGFFRGEGRLPAARELDDARARVGYRHLVLDARDRTIAFDRPGLELDLGGIAKGYAVDRAVGILRQRGVAAALVSAGGSTLYGLGAPPDRPDGWQVSLQDPLDARKTALTVTLRDRALSIAGASEKFFEAGGVRYSHIMDPRTGRPVQGVLTVAVLTATGTAGDALDDVLFVQGVEWSRTYLRTLPATEALFFQPAPSTAPRWTMVRIESP